MKNKKTLPWSLKKLYDSTCKNCLQGFEGKKNQKYCSRKCSQKFNANKHYKANRAVLSPEKKLRARYSTIRSRAARKGLQFDLTYEQLLALVDVKTCAYCGVAGSLEVDRKSPLLGYVWSNVVGACKRCNTIKSNVLSYDEMIYFAKYVESLRGRPIGVI